MKAVTRKTCAILIFLFNHVVMNAQTKPSPAGEYYLRGEAETASGFKLDKDSSFQFFFSYGALDRYGKGHWHVVNDTLLFNSGQKPARDFKLLSATPGTGPEIRLQIKGANTALLRHFYCRIKGGGRQQEGATDEKGMVAFKPQQMDTIEILFEFCPEKVSVFHTTAKGFHNFVFAPEPWLMEVFFQDFRLAVEPDGLHGAHPMSDKTSFFYERAGNKK